MEVPGLDLGSPIILKKLPVENMHVYSYLCRLSQGCTFVSRRHISKMFAHIPIFHL